MFTIIPQSKLNGKISGIKKSGITLQANIHLVACSIIHHASEHGDYSRMNTLLDALPASVRRSDFGAWVLAFTPLNFDKKKGKFTLSKDPARKYDANGAYAIPFWEMTEDKDQLEKPIDAMALLYSLQTKVKNAQTNGKEVQNLDKFNSILANVVKPIN